jgi:hypothetical protein
MEISHPFNRWFDLATCERLALTIYCLLDQMVLALRSTLATNNYTLAYAFSLTFFFVTIINISC